MKVKFSKVLFGILLTFLGFVSYSAQAQGEGFSGELQDPNHSELNLNEDKSTSFESDSKAKNSLHDSISSQVRTSVISSKTRSSDRAKSAGTKEEEDALSYNFLYYIIQKFKISDLIDE